MSRIVSEPSRFGVGAQGEARVGRGAPAGLRQRGPERPDLVLHVNVIETGIHELIAAYEATLPFALDEFQREAIIKLERSRGVLGSAPTSSGMTVVADYVIWRRLDAPAALRRPITDAADAVYTTPMKALSNQKHHDLCVRFGEHRIGLITGEHTLNDGAPVIVMTTEILRNVLYDEPARVDRVGDVVLDEIHYIDDYPRGTAWEELIIEAHGHSRLLGLCAP